MTSRIRTALEGLLVLTVVLMILSAMSYVCCHYETDGTIVAVSGDEVTVSDVRGEAWSYLDTTPLPVGSHVVIKFDNNGTDDTIYDDIIEKVMRKE